MKSDLEDLRISQDQLEKLTELEIGKVFMGGVVRPSALRSPGQLLSFLVSEFSVLAVVFIVCLGFGLVIVRSWDSFNNVFGLIAVAIGITIAGAIAWNGYQWQRYKALKTLSRLLDEVDRHNDIVQAIQVMDELQRAQSSAPAQISNRAEILSALAATRDSLISALMTERILRYHQTVLQQGRDLMGSIETNLAALQALQVSNQATEYQQFLQEALDIGLAVQQEMMTQTDEDF
ncbi:hypothetical protein PN498_13665 [Oscillatoria sp. CS-180]|uniref:hypothetical protein n=1 Tax=Oscillatoria sp. CS-180 TaxID=3021720 RepID=UPI00232D00B6|nr:hypothetical protein [Oscillatoria sp. CS-180]MDB9527043.1 hypothetical protein [Oscillatoria sp. CS-180]